MIWNGEKCDQKWFSVIQKRPLQPFCENKSCILIWNSEKCDQKWFWVIQYGRWQPFCEQIKKIKTWVLMWNGEKCDRKWFSVIQNGHRQPFCEQNQNKRPLGLTAPLSNNTLCMIYNPMNTKLPWFDLSMPPKVKCHDVNWKTIYRIWFTMCSWQIVYDVPFRRYNLSKSCDLDSTLKMYLMSNVLR